MPFFSATRIYRRSCVRASCREVPAATVKSWKEATCTPSTKPVPEIPHRQAVPWIPCPKWCRRAGYRRHLPERCPASNRSARRSRAGSPFLVASLHLSAPPLARTWLRRSRRVSGNFRGNSHRFAFEENDASGTCRKELEIAPEEGCNPVRGASSDSIRRTPSASVKRRNLVRVTTSACLQVSIPCQTNILVNPQYR